MEEEIFLYLKGASGLTDRVAMSELDQWKKRQEELKAKGVSPERTAKMLAELSEKISQKIAESEK